MDSRGFSACWIKAVESKIIQNCMFMRACSDIELVLKRVQRYIVWWVNQLHGKINLRNKEIEIKINCAYTPGKSVSRKYKHTYKM
mgnify:CR=1 FL=1